MFNFCRSKCHRNFKMRRNPRKVRWTKAYRQLAGKDLANDTTFEMERRRNRPVKYNRDVLRATLKAMKRVNQARTRREAAWHAVRKRGKALRAQREAKRELQQDATLVRASQGRQAESQPAVEPMAVEHSHSHQPSH